MSALAAVAVASYASFHQRSVSKILLLALMLCMPLSGQSVSEIAIEKSSDLQNWQEVPVTPEMVTPGGRVVVPNNAAQQFYRMRVRLLDAPSIEQSPAASTGIDAGDSATLVLDAKGEDLLFQWYQGESGDISKPIAGANGKTYTSGPLESDAAYWVRVRNSAGIVDSATAFVLINRPPTITAQPDSPTIYSGNTATLAVEVSGTAPLRYQWYRGSLGATTAPVGTNSPTFTTPALTVTTKYWVKITNAFGEANSSSLTVTVQANTAPIGFSLIPAGSFSMGDALDGASGAPTHTVNVSAFYMAQNLVTKADWDTVRTWAISNGYSDLAAGAGKASDHPVQKISWFQMVKYCNARSQQEGLTPVYYTNDAQDTVYKTGDVDITNAQVKWAANGYRLPTEAEWEKAARGGLSGKRFPWGDTISQSQANYYAGTGYSYDLSEAFGYHPTYATGSFPYTSPVGSFAANGYGLYDMAGNVWQCCWDWYGAYDTGTPTDPRGASWFYVRLRRGGSWGDDLAGCRVAHRYGHAPSEAYDNLGFRVARSLVP